MAFGDKLRYLREYQGISQQQVAKDLQIGQSLYSRYESGQHEPNFATLRKISSYFNVSVDYLLENFNEDITELTDLEYFLLHGNYTIFSHFPKNEDRKMLSAIVTAIYLKEKK